jgi:RHS repeat-associated protein
MMLRIAQRLAAWIFHKLGVKHGSARRQMVRATTTVASVFRRWNVRVTTHALRTLFIGLIIFPILSAAQGVCKDYSVVGTLGGPNPPEWYPSEQTACQVAAQNAVREWNKCATCAVNGGTRSITLLSTRTENQINRSVCFWTFRDSAWPGEYTDTDTYFFIEHRPCAQPNTPPSDICPAQDGGSTNQPITPATGEKQLYETDWVDAGLHSLSVRRTYRSQLAVVAPAILMPARWYLSPFTFGTGADGPVNREVYLGSGNVRIFDAAWYNSAGQTSPESVIRGGYLDVLTRTATGSEFKQNDDQSVWLFDNVGRPLTHTQRNGWVMTYSYNAANQLTTITNHFGRSLQFGYNGSGQLSQITTPDSKTIRYEYDNTNNPNTPTTPYARLTKVTHPDNTTRQYLYENPSFPHLLTGVVDENATRLSTYSYDAQGRAIETTKAQGIDRYQVSYGNAGSNGNITSATITDPLGTPRSYNYSTSLSQLAVTGADKPSGQGLNDAASRVQSALGLIESETDFLGFTTQYQWDTARRLKTQETMAAGRPEQQSIQTEWHPTFRLPATVTEQGKTTAYTYDAAGNVLTQLETDTTGNASSGQTRTWAFTYSAQNLPLTMQDARGQVWSFQYDSAGNRTRITNPLGHASNYTYDGAGRVLTETAPNGLVTSYQYDPRGRLTQITRGSNLAVALRQTTAYTYRPSGQIASAQLPNGHAISYTYDAAQRLIAASDNRGNSIAYTLDPMGNRVAEQIKDANQQIALASSRVINSLNRVQAIQGGTNPSAQTTAFQYDANGEPIRATDPLGHATQTTLDALRRPIATTLPDGNQVDYYYNQLNQLTDAVDPKGVATNYVRNAWGEVLSETSPDIGQTAYTRDPAGNVLSMQDAKGQLTSYQYDALSRVTQINFADGKQQSFLYDGTATGQQRGYLREMIDASGNTKYERDAFGRITKKTQTVNDNPTNPTVLISQYTYTPAGDIATLRYPSGLLLSYTRSASGQVSGITTKIGSAAARPFVSDLSYTALGQPKAWSWAHCTTATLALGPCTSEQRSFDADARMLSSAVATLQYDANSRITAITQNLWAERTVPATSSTAAFTQRYTTPISWAINYDNRDRITRFARSLPASAAGQHAAASSAYTYDANSNRLSSIAITATDTDKDGLFETSEQRKNQAQQLSIEASSNRLLGFSQTVTTLTGTRTNSTVNAQVNYTLDANGNLTSDGLRTFQYDGSDRLSKVILGSTFVGTDSVAGNELAAHTYLHNAAGQRVFKSEPKTEATTPDSATLGTGFVDWLRTNFSWLWATAQTNATLGDSYLYAESSAGIPSWALLGEYGNGGASSTGRTEYIWLPTQDGSAIPVGILRAGKLHAIHTDHLGTPRLITNETNTVQWQWPYSAFGDNAPTGILKPTTSAASAFTSIPAAQGSGTTTATLLATSTPTQINNLRFPGQYADSETGLFYNYYRTYQPNQGRYTQNDPIGLDGGLNRMGYVDGDPINFTDPEGLTRRGGGPVVPMFPRIGPTLPPANPQVGTTRNPIEIPRGTNAPGQFGGVPFSGHAFDRTQGRGIPPSVVTNTIFTGQRSPGSLPNTTQYYDRVNNVTVVVNSTTGNVITIRNGPPSTTCPPN